MKNDERFPRHISPVTRWSVWLVALTVLAGCSGLLGTGAPAKKPLGGGAGSMDALLDELLGALAARDKDALHRLRVTRVEYEDIIIPGTVEVGRPPRRIDEKKSAFFWALLDAKSLAYEEVLMNRWGGRTYTRKQLALTKGERQYAGYTAYGEVRLLIEDEDGEERVLETGWIAAVDGTYKFIGFEYD